jgi:hypothetical protein
MKKKKKKKKKWFWCLKEAESPQWSKPNFIIIIIFTLTLRDG